MTRRLCRVEVSGEGEGRVCICGSEQEKKGGELKCKGERSDWTDEPRESWMAESGGSLGKVKILLKVKGLRFLWGGQ